jgi:transcription initiation factor TFIID subunit 1
MFQRRIERDEGLFLLIRSPHGGFSMREVTEYFVLGQQEPHVEVFQPNTDRCRDFEERAINAAVIFSLVKQRAEKVPEEDMRVKVSDIERQFNGAIADKDIRRRIRRKILLPVRAPGQRRKANDDYYDDDADEFELNPSYRFEDDLMLHRMCPPEDVVAYESMRAALARLQAGRDERGAARIRRLAGTSQTQALQAFQATLRGATPAQREGLTDLELLLALQPWAQTTGVPGLPSAGEPCSTWTRRGACARRPGKFYHYVRRQPPKDPEGAAAQPKIKPGHGYGHGR